MITGEDLFYPLLVAYRPQRSQPYWVMLEIDGEPGVIEFDSTLLSRAEDGNGRPIEYRIEREFDDECRITDFWARKIADGWRWFVYQSKYRSVREMVQYLEEVSTDKNRDHPAWGSFESVGVVQ